MKNGEQQSLCDFVGRFPHVCTGTQEIIKKVPLAVKRGKNRSLYECSQVGDSSLVSEELQMLLTTISYTQKRIK